MSILEEARICINELGWKIFPVHGINNNYCDCNIRSCTMQGKHPLTHNGFKSASNEINQINEWWKRTPTANVALSTGKDNNVFVLDIDKKNNGIESLKNKIENHAPLPKTVKSLTGSGGFHYFFTYNERVKTRVGVFSGIDIRADGGYVVLPPSNHITGTKYQWINSPKNTQIVSAPDWLIDLLATTRNTSGYCTSEDEKVPEGSRNSRLASLCGSLRHKNLHKSAALAAVLKENELKCNPPLDNCEIETIVNSIYRYPVNVRISQTVAPVATATVIEEVEVPQEEPEMHPVAYRGILREYIDTLKEYTEASDAGLLFSFLISFGNIIRRNMYFKYSQTLHHTNEYLVLVGESSKARKGTTLDHMRALFSTVDPEWTKTRWLTSVASGEGIISILKQPKAKSTTTNWGRYGWTKDAQQPPETGEESDDKRLLLTLTEFSSILQIMKRPGSTVSSVIRDAWDHGFLQNNTKWDATRVEGAHVSCIGHITIDELKFELDRLEFANGFANRFLWAYTKRSKFLPDAAMPEGALSNILPCLAGTINNCSGRSPRNIKKDSEATDLWQRVYPIISSALPGVLGAITARAEAHIMRIALIYALLDRVLEIGKVHLQAALAVWKYNLDTCALIFGDFVGNRIADEILAALKTATQGITKQDMRKLSYNITGPQIDVSLQLLKRNNMVFSKCNSTSMGNIITWFYKPSKKGGEDLKKYIEE